MTPTDRALILYNFLIDPISKLERAEDLFHRNSKIEGPTISIGMSFESYVFSLEDHIAKLPFNLIVRTGEYQQMIHELETGELDLILTPQKGHQASLEYQPFSKQRTILICGATTDTSVLETLIDDGDRDKIQKWLRQQIWYTNAASMEHLKNFWMLNFGSLPDFKPNYVLPYFNNIIKSLTHGKGFAMVPDHLCRNELLSGQIKLPWPGSSHLEDIIYFGKRIKAIYPKEILQLQDILSRRWATEQ